MIDTLASGSAFFNRPGCQTKSESSNKCRHCDRRRDACQRNEFTEHDAGHQECENDDGKRTYASTIMVVTNKSMGYSSTDEGGGNLRGPITGHDQCVLKWTFGAAGAWGHHASSIAATTSAAAASLRLS